jgi:protein TonB
MGQKGMPAPDARGTPLREKLFDKGIIGDLAKREVEKKEKETKDTSFTFDAREYKFLLYNRRLKERIESIWVYPPDAAAQGIYGDLVLRFTIKKDGKIGTLELVRTSGHKNLDDSAMRALKDGSPYWPLPDEWGMDSYTIEGHFVYTLYGYYIR